MYNKEVFLAAVCMTVAATFSSDARAVTLHKNDPMVVGALECTRHFPRYERELGIPTHLLSAIASTESGRFHKNLKINLPWPWTISSGGKGQYFKSKKDAVAAVKKLQAQGVKNIDIGCMQVNMYHHGEAFSSIEQAFEPRHNIAYAAKFLRKLYNESGVWKEAASDYHSRTPSLGRKYVSRVYNSWYSIIQKLREARVAVPNSSVAELNAMKTSKRTTQLASAEVQSASITPAKRIDAADVKVYRAPKMREISVSHKDTRVQIVQDGIAHVGKSITASRPIDKSGMIVLDAARSTSPASAASHLAPVVAPAMAPPVANPAVAEDLPVMQQGASSGVPPVTVASHITYPTDNGAVAPAQAPALVGNSNVQAGVTVNVPLQPVAQAALMPVTGIINAGLQKASASLNASAALEPVTAQIIEPAQVTVDYAAHRVLESGYAERSGPRFIFSQ